MLRGRSAAVAAALAIAAAAAVTAGCGGGSTSGALSLDPVAAAATKTQQAGAARVRFVISFSSPLMRAKAFRLRGAGVIDGTSAELNFKLGSMSQQAGLGHGSVKEVLLKQSGDYVIYLRLSLLASKIPGHKQWIKLDLSKLGKAAGVDFGNLMSGSELQPTDLLSVLKGEGADVKKLGSATIDGAATTHYRVTIDTAKELKSKGLMSPLFSRFAAKMKTITENVWIGKTGLVRRLAFAYKLPLGDAPQLAMTMDLYDYGAHVSIAAPPSSRVFDITSFAQKGLGGASLP
jgi:hypothetical protein